MSVGEISLFGGGICYCMVCVLCDSELLWLDCSVFEVLLCCYLDLLL